MFLYFVCIHAVWNQGSQPFPARRLSDKSRCLAVIVYVTQRAGWAEWLTSFFRAIVQRENQDVLFTRRMLRRLTWIRFCVLILSRLRVRTFTVWFLCHAFMIDLAIVWDVAFLLIEMCPWWCVCADVYRTISCYYVSVHLVSFSLFRLYFGVRELCVARFVVLQLLFWLAIVEGGCISRIMYMQVKCMKMFRACNLSRKYIMCFDLFKGQRLTSCQQCVRRHLSISMHVCGGRFIYVVISSGVKL